jgi:hypothetical protein
VRSCADPFSEELSIVLMDENTNKSQVLAGMTNDKDSLHRRRSVLTGDSLAILVGTCIGLFILVASTLAYFLTIDLAVLLGRASVYVWFYLHAS